MAELQAELQRLSGTTLDAQGAANAWAGTTGLDLVGAINAKAGTAGLDLARALNQLAGTAGLEVGAAAAAITSGGDPTMRLTLPGANGNYASTPDSAGNSITGDIDIRAKLSMADWTPTAQVVVVAKAGSTGTRSYSLEWS
ncbi:MAG TPA: hypothetical protein VEG38_02060, partial [Acidimicrobiia bacterium]|nr:hypothetical protein [Acidimicrobiia bacterium]